LKKWLREPLLHFILIGGGLFLLYGLQNDGFENDDNRIVISEADIDRLITLWQKKRQRLPTQSELNGMVEQQIRGDNWGQSKNTSEFLLRPQFFL